MEREVSFVKYIKNSLPWSESLFDVFDDCDLKRNNWERRVADFGVGED